MTSSKFWFSLALALFVAGCSTESRRKLSFDETKSYDFPEDSGTTFRVDKIEPVSIVTQFKSDKYRLVRQKQFNLKACFQDKAANNLTGGIQFRVSDGVRSARTLTTDVKGCVYWMESYEFTYLADEVFLRFTRQFQPVDRYRGTVYATVAINPWSDAAAGAMVDLRYQTVPTTALRDIGPITMDVNGSVLANPDQKTLNINLDSVNFDFIRLNMGNYKVSPLLGLSVAHDYLVTIKPQVIRQTLTKAATAESFVGGSMKVYFAIFREKHKIDPSRAFSKENLISSSEFIVSDEKAVGLFFGNVTINFDRINEMTSRTFALMTLVPLDPIPGLKEMSFSGVLKPGRLAKFTPVPANAFSARQIIEDRNTAERSAPTLTALDVLKSKLREMNPAPVPHALVGYYGEAGDYDLTPALTAYGNDPKAVRLAAKDERALCYKLFEDQNAIQRCAGQPQAYLSYSRRQLVDSILSAPVHIGVTSVETLKMSASFSRQTSVSGAWTGRANAGIGFDPLKIPLLSELVSTVMEFIPFLKINVGADYGYARTWTTSDSESVVESVSSDSAVTSEGNTFKFRAALKGCTIVEAKPQSTGGWWSEAKPAPLPKGIFFCPAAAVERDATESYYLLGQNIGLQGSPFSDSEGSSSGAWRALVRGRRTVSLLYDLIKDTKTKLVLERMPDQDLRSELYMVQEAPGLLSAQ